MQYVAKAADVSRVEVALEHAKVMSFQVVSTISYDACLQSVYTLFQGLQVPNDRGQNL
jgi:hypothetical protein